MTSHWYEPLLAVESRGSQVDPVGGLAGLAAARAEHLGQFFTPLAVVRFMWAVTGLADAPEPDVYGSRGRWHVFDGAFGSGRMFSPARPDTHALHGIEVDRDVAERVIEAASAAEFTRALHVGSMVDYTLAKQESGSAWSSSVSDRFHVGLINPPFSLHFDSPNVAKWPEIATFGKYGAASSTVSQKLAVAQALAWCDVVAAVVPRTFADAYLSERETAGPSARLRFVFHLPRSVFRSEGAEVDTSVMVWQRLQTSRPPEVVDLRAGVPDDPPWCLRLEYERRFPSLQRVDAPKDEPAKFGRSDKLGKLIRAGKLSAPPNERRVKLSHDGRHITVSATDAATYARAMNWLLTQWTGHTEHRRTKLSLYSGQGRLDIECLLAQDDPTNALDSIIAALTSATQAHVEASPELRNYLRKRQRRHAVNVTPFGHTALVEDGGFADWLAEQQTARVRFLPDKRTPRRHDYYTPGATEPCPRCTDGEGNIQVEDCWKCKGTRVVDVESVEQACTILRRMRTTVVERAPRREHGRDKEDRSERHWFVEHYYDAGQGYVDVECPRCAGKPSQYTCRHCEGLGVEQYSKPDNDGTLTLTPLVGRTIGRWSEAEMVDRCEFVDFVPLPGGWTRVHEGLAERFPERYKNALARARNLGIDKWLWSYQLADLCEVSLKRGAIIAWEMGLGKARLAAALCLLGGGKHNLITVETRLIREMEAEFKAIGLPKSSWQTITKPEHARDLRTINLISYDKLKSTLPGKKRPRLTDEEKADAKRSGDKPRTYDVRHTFASLLRRRVHTHVCDEGHLLRAPTTQQSRAVHHVSAKGPRYLLTGTPIANYPRDVLWLLQWALGDGTAAQVYGNRYPLMRPENLHDYGSAPRGVDEFRDRFVTLRWVTNEFADEMQEGAKREVPVIADIPGFRKVVQHVIKRRVAAEPDVAQHVRIPVPTRGVVQVKWDRDHFAYYHETVRTFVQWYLAEQERLARLGERDGDGKGLRLIAILQQLIAVYQAANYPQGGVGGQPEWTGGDTSKQRLAVGITAGWVAEGHKVITYSKSPALAMHTAKRLRERGIDVVEFHGGISITKRVDALDKRFREGKAQVLAATRGCLQTGYNLAVASRVLHIDWEWTPSVVHQSDARVLRPQQRRDVVIKYLGLRGSIDDYQRQMVEQKGLTMAAGLDYGAGPPPDAEFKHIDSLLNQFVKDFADLAID